MSNSNRSKKYHFIYKTTNLLNKKFYIGMHSTSNLKDGYLGSGRSLRYAIRKYGEENFKIEIIEWCDGRDELIKREREIITEDYVNDRNCYNMKPGGTGGFNNKNHQFKCSQAAGLKHSQRIKTDKVYRESYSQKISDANKRRISRGDFKPWNETYSWKGKHHSPESIEKMRRSKKGTGVSEKNSQFGSRWITNGKDNLKLKKGEPLPENWEFGRTLTNKEAEASLSR